MRPKADHLSASMAGPPGPENLLSVGEPAAGRTSSLAVLQGLIAEHGDFVHYRTRYGTFFLVNQPELVREVLCGADFVRNRLLKTVLGDGLLSSEGRHWEQQRRRILPVFQPRRIDGMVETFRRITEERMAAWRSHATGAPRDVTREMFRIALASVGRVLFGADFDDRFLDALDCSMHEISAIQNAATFGFPLVRRASGRREYREAMEAMEAAIEPLVTVSRNQGCPASPLLDVLATRGALKNDQTLSARQIRDEILTMVIAGHETTAVALCWALRAIAAHPEVAERFYTEIDRVIGERPITASDIPRLVYTRMLIDETLRLFPPVWMVARTAASDVPLGEYEIQTGAGVLISPFALHRHPNYWHDPERFDPERFAADAAPPVPYSYLPFLAGRHLCLGKYFSLSEMVVVLATLAQQYRFYPIDDQPVEYEPLVSLRIRGGLKLRIESRSGRGAR